MKKYLIKIVLFFIVVAVIDLLFGHACQYMNSHSKGGGTKSRYYVCKQSNEDVLIFGSSRAKHHYVPDIIEDSLGMTCYNAGEDGNGIILSYGFLKMITERYSPRIIIYDVSLFDVYKDDNIKYLDLLKPYYNEPGIDSLFWDIEPKTRVMMYSNLYRYNTTWLRVAGSFFHPMSESPKGYFPLYGVMSYEPEAIISEKEKIEDEVKLMYFEQFIHLAKEKGIYLICCVSPTYKPIPDGLYNESIQQLCNNNSIPFYDYRDIKEISYDRDLFQDKTHLNDNGAREYSRIVVNRIKALYNRE